MKPKTLNLKLTLAILVAMLFGTASMQAATYDLWLCGTQVTDANKGNLSVINGVSGSVSYNSDTKVLSLNNANIYLSDGANTIKSQIDGLTVNVQGTNSVGSSGWAAVRFEKSATIEGGGTLNVSQNKPDQPGWSIYAHDNSSLTIKNCTVNTTDGSAGIIGSRGGTLTIENAYISAGSSSESISRFADIVLISAAIMSPSGAVVSNGPDTFKAVRNSSGAILSGTVTIEPFYELWICGKQATPQNKDNLQALTVGASGTLKYNPVNKKLTMNNLVISDFSTNLNEPRIKSNIEGLTIEILGNDNNIYNGLKGIELNGTTTITGGGKLRLSNSGYEFGIHSTAQLTIRSCTVDVVSQNGGITGNGTNKLTIDNATVSANASHAGVITNFGNIVLKNSLIAAPQGVMVSKASDSFFAFRHNLTGNVIVNQQINIVPGIIYNLWINGVQVNSQNKGDLTVIPGVTGTASYNSDTKTLSLNNATMSITGKACCVLSKIDGMAIDVTGTNTLNSNGWSTLAYEDNNSGIIRGSGTLNLNNDNPDDAAIHMRSGSLSVYNCTLNGTGKNYGIYSSSGNSSINIDNATVSMKGGGTGSIYNVAALNLNGCVIAQPVGARFSTTEKTVVSGNTTVKTEVKILPGTAYNLFICGVQVTSVNKDDLTVINGYDGCTVSGGVSYNPDTRTLTLNNATINRTSGDAIACRDGGINIELIGNNTVTSGGWAIGFTSFSGQAPGSIHGSGTLNATSTGESAIESDVPLTIKNCTITATGKDNGICGYNNSKLTIDGATVSATGTGLGSINGFSELSLLNCAIAQPLNAVYDTNQKAIVADGNIVKTQVNIVLAYNLYICGKQVTVENKDDLTVIDGYNGCTVSGGVSYNPDTRTLTLNNATINKTSGEAIVCDDGGVNIELIGNNTVTSYGTAIAFIYLKGQAPGSIYGSGTLNASSTIEIAIETDVPLTIRNCTITATGKDNGIYGFSNDKLTIDGATVSATGTDLGSIKGFSELSLLNCVIAQPLNAVYDTNQKAIVVDGNIVNTQVDIVPAYDLWIWGTQVTSINCSNLAAIIGATEGSISYDPATTTLTLDNVKTDNSGDKNTIKSSIEGLKINIVGSNTLKADGWSLIDVSSNSTIEGSGTLNIENIRDDYCINVQNSATLTIKNCNLNVTSPKVCINGNLNEKLIIDNATVSAANNDFNYKLVYNFNTIDLINCFISEPVRAKINNGSIDVGANKFLKIIPGTAYDLWVGGVRITPDNKDDLSVIPAVTGTVSYNPDTQTLLLDNATINSGIISEIDGLIIELTGIGNIIADNDNGILSYKPFTIQGRGTLNVNSNNKTAIRANSTSLTVKNCKLNLVGWTYGIFGNDAGLATLTIDNADVSALSYTIGGGYGGAIVGFNAINTTDCSIIEPSGAVFNPDKKAICYADGTIVGGEYNPLKIAATSYNLWIGGTQVTNNNKANFTAGVTQGTVSYNSDTKTLTLTNATIDATTGNNKGILSAIDELKIELVGNNTVKSSNNTGIYLENPATISGSGTLNVTATGTDQTAIYIYKTRLKINNCTVEATGNGYGIRGFNGSVEELHINNATVTAQGASAGSITHFNVIAFPTSLIDIVEPLDAEIRWGADAAYAVRDKSSQAIITDKVKIGLIPWFIYNGNWNDPDNWSTGTVPGATQKVVIDAFAEITEDIEVAEFKIYSGGYIIVKPGKKLTVTRKSINNGYIGLLSDVANGTATLVGDVAGRGGVQQAAVNYRTYYLSSPVSGTVTTGENMGDYITFTESTDQWSTTAPFAGITPVAGKGYGVQVGADVEVSEIGNDTTFYFEGTLNNGEVKIPITSGNRRFNFVGNPYPSYLNTVEVVKDPNIERSLWFYSKQADKTYQFTAYNVPTGISIPDEGHDYGYIPPMQGFWVRANEGVNTDYVFTNEMRVHKPAGSNAAFRAPQAEEKQLLRLQLSNGIIKDEAAVLFSEETTNDWNTPKMMSQKLCIYTLKDGENLALNSSKSINYDVEIPVGVKAESGVYTFSASKFENFGTEKVLLLDKVANTVTNLSNNDIHTVNFAEAYEGTDRFALVFPRSGVISGCDGTAQTHFFAFAKDKRITVSSNAQSGTIYVYNSVGQQVAAEAISSNLTTVSAVLPEGVYVVKLNNQTAKVVVK